MNSRKGLSTARSIPRISSVLLGIAALFLSVRLAEGQGFVTVANPHWNITLSDFGYSDFLLDNTPGFQGREYLSGEWGAAVGYQVEGRPLVPPQWLEPHFAYPDWTTPSTFDVVSPLTELGLNADGLPIAQAVIANADIQITLDYEMLDTVVGIPMGTVPASAGGSGASLSSDRYVLKQTYTVKNISGSTLNNLQLFQFLHGLQSQRGVYDDRLYAGSFNHYSNDVTLVGVDEWAVSAGSSASGLEDYIGFQSFVVPTAYEIGYYGIEGNGVDFHSLGKPSEGVHLSIEDNWQTAPYAARQGTDNFAPAQRWIAGAERWTLGTLANGQSVSLDVLLSLRTGTKVDLGTGSSGGCNGGSSVPGGLDYSFDDVTGSGSCFAEYAQADAAEIEVRVAHGEFGSLDFLTPGGPAQIWNVSFSGTFSGSVSLSFAFDPMLLPPGFDETALCLYQYYENAWHWLGGTQDPLLPHAITVTATSLSAFALGVDGGNAYTVSAGTEPANSGTITGTGTYADGSSATLVAAANAGYAFSNWTESATVVSTSPSYTFTVHNDRTLVANFSIAGASKTVATSSLPINGGSTSGDGAYALSSSATVVATALDGYKFSKWMTNGVTVSTAKSYQFTVTQDVALVAKFNPAYRVVVSPYSDPPGDSEVEADSTLYDPGDLATLKVAHLQSGYAFVNWTEHGLPVSSDPNFQFTVSGNRELVGNFILGNRINVIVQPNHAGTTSGGGVYAAGSGVTVDAVANPGYIFVNWTEGSNVVGTATSYSLTSDAEHTLVANFLTQPGLGQLLSAPAALTLYWPADATGWSLEECGELSSGSWMESTNTVDVVGAQKQVTITPLNTNGFFRLVHP
jgi:hypothetical protein